MSEAGHSKRQGNHDDCQDCRREKKQNEAFIAIYEKLQNIEKKSLRVKQAVDKHKAISETNRSFYKSVEKKIVSLPKLRDRTDTHAMEKVGFEIAAAVLEKQARNNLYKQNLRLKQVISSMQKDKLRQETPHRSQNLMLSSKNDTSTLESNAQISQSFNSTLSSNQDKDKENLEKLIVCQDGSYTQNQNAITQSTSFKSTNFKKQMDLSRYGDMNLWLYEHEKHAKLQQDLYVTHSKNRSISRKAGYLPTLRVHK